MTEYKPGDRVAAFHRMLGPHGAHAEYAIAPATTTFTLSPNISFEEGSTIPLAAMTAALALYQDLGVPLPWSPVPKGKSHPILIYGGASAVGAFAIKLAKLSGLSPIITVAGNGIPFVGSLEAADAIIDYRKSDVPTAIREALGSHKLLHAFDAIAGHNSWQHILEVLDRSSGTARLDVVDPPEGVNPWPPRGASGITFTRTFVASAYGEPHADRNAEEAARDRDFAYIMYRCENGI